MYDFKIQPLIESGTFNGQMDMKFKCLLPTDKIIFHSIDLILDKNSFKLKSLDSETSVENDYIEDKLTNFITIKLKKNCKKDFDYSLSFKYQGIINTNLYGLYPSSYTDNTGKMITLLTTHFHPTDARRV